MVSLTRNHEGWLEKKHNSNAMGYTMDSSIPVEELTKMQQGAVKCYRVVTCMDQVWLLFTEFTSG